MNINPGESTIGLKQQLHSQILFDPELDKHSSSSEQFLLSIYNSVQTSIFIVDVLKDGDFCYVALNPTHERWLGISSENLKGKQPEDILSPVDAAKVRQHYADCVRFGKTISYEQCLQFQGVATWWSTTLTPLRDANSRIYRLIGTSSNITPVKQVAQAKEIQTAQEQLLEAIAQWIRESLDLDTLLHQLVKEVRHCLGCDRILVYSIQADETGVVIAESTVTANSCMGQKFPEPSLIGKYQERRGRGCIQIIEDIYTAGLHPSQVNLLESWPVRANLVVPIWSQQQLWGLITAQHCHQPHQWQEIEIDLLKQLATQIGIAVHQAKLHEQVQHLQTQLKLQKQQYQVQIQQAQNFQLLVRRITEQIRDHQPATLVMQTVTQELTQLLQLQSCYIEIYSACGTQTTVTYEYTTTAPEHQKLTRNVADLPAVYQPLLAKQHWQSLEIVPGWHPQLQVLTRLACPIFDDQGILGNLWLNRATQDMFDEREISLVQQVANECAIALRQAKNDSANQVQRQVLAQQERLQNEFLRTLSHELRTPITSISLAAQTLESVLTPGGILDIEIVPQLLQILQNECGRESKLISDLMQLSYLEAEPQIPTFITIDLQTWLPPIVESFRDLSHCQRQKLYLNINQQLPPLETDITDLERIITELLSYACKYTPSGEAISVSADFTVDAVQLKISNSGLDIPASEMPRIFEPFHRLMKNDPWTYSGTGLEMALVQKMVKHLGGSINVESVNSQTTFMIKFPR
ncbi:GAF domain-containing protein [Nostoc sp. PCC 7107]|uniref:GAF domain-containing protein n=1 Tax=Nostoc sp. PCC 7107 TaxID=317936 RepID=UPI00029F3B06|nr:GAF domain-containing protein [Nostoc sp. PCC 7107]AFY45446.1 multi-sensor signal transduction histidine kinase [Nostoc sp. PCC 7107]